ncbi:MAG: acyl-CoA dehydrogenase family protein [Burkholderiaceae bacterium]
MTDDLDPVEFEDAANRIIASCADAADIRARAGLLSEGGLLGILAPEAASGLDLPLRFAIPVVRAAGAGLLQFPLIESLLLARAVGASDPATAGRITEGESIATIAWSGVGEAGVVGNAPSGTEADLILVFRADGSALLASCRDVRSVAAQAQSWDLTAPAATIDIGDALDGLVLDPAGVGRLRNDADLLRAAFVHGSSGRCLSLAVAYAQEREQFGRPLSGFQALRHKLSRDALITQTIANSIERALRHNGDDIELVRRSAWINAAINGPTVAEDAIQVFGGMGFTWDVPLHRHLRQMRAQSAYGEAAASLEALGQSLLADSANPWYEVARRAS